MIIICNTKIRKVIDQDVYIVKRRKQKTIIHDNQLFLFPFFVVLQFIVIIESNSGCL